MCASPRFYCTVDLLREFARGKLKQRDRNPVMPLFSSLVVFFHHFTCLKLWFGKVLPHNLSLIRLVSEFVKVQKIN